MAHGEAARLQLPATRIHVCSLAAVPETVATVNATHLMTVINAQTLVETPVSIEAKRHLKIAINDISLPQEGLVHLTRARRRRTHDARHAPAQHDHLRRAAAVRDD